MGNKESIHGEYLTEKERIFQDASLRRDPYQFCLRLSLLVEDYIKKIIPWDEDLFLASTGSFARRELAPHSDIDLMFVAEEISGKEERIQDYVRELYDCGIEVSHTVRDFSDIKRYRSTEVPGYTQIIETRFLLGSYDVFANWQARLFSDFDSAIMHRFFKDFMAEIEDMHRKYGASPKVLEPNLKYTAGNLRDFQTLEWIFSIFMKKQLLTDGKVTQIENFLEMLAEMDFANPREVKKLRASYGLILWVRNELHLLTGRKTDRFEFSYQEKISSLYRIQEVSWQEFMRRFFAATSCIYRFSNTMVKRIGEKLTSPMSDYLSIVLDDDFYTKGNVLSSRIDHEFSMSEIMRAFYFRGLSGSVFDDELRSRVIDSLESNPAASNWDQESSIFFKEIFTLKKNLVETLKAMNELGVLGVFIPEFKDLIGFFQPGVYHCYTTDEHSLVALQSLENLASEESHLASVYGSIKHKPLLYLATLLHDIAKPLTLSGHEIIGSEITSTIMERLGYGPKEVEMVQFLIQNHLKMEQTAFRRNLNDPETLDSFTLLFHSEEALKMLYVLTYADLSAVNDMVWTEWKRDLLRELYKKSMSMLEERISGEELLYRNTLRAIGVSDDEKFNDHIKSMDDSDYIFHFTRDEISEHVREIETGEKISVFFKKESGTTNITVITKDYASLLSRLCGAFAINDLNILNARIFTRKDGIVIDSFNVVDYRSHSQLTEDRYDEIKMLLSRAVTANIELSTEFARVRSKWWRIESRVLRHKSKIQILFEDHEKYTIIEVHSADRLGLLYKITEKMNDIGLSIYFAKIATKGDDVVDSFYVLDSSKRKLSKNQYELIKYELHETISEIL